MFRAMLYTHWKWARWPLGLAVLISFAVPVFSVQQAGLGFGSRFDRFSTSSVLSTIELYSMVYPVLAALVAVLIAATAWAADEKGHHVYRLALPLPRWHYALLRLGAGGVLLIAPVVGVMVGAFVAAAAATPPPGTEAHPAALTIRFALAAGVAYTVVFALVAAGNRAARFVAVGMGLVIVAQVVFALLGGGDVVQFLGESLLLWPGPLEIFTGRWMLIDV